MSAPLRAHAEGIHIKSAELIPTEAGYALDATYEIALTPTLEEALLRGVAAAPSSSNSS